MSLRRSMQASFASGEIDHGLRARVDLQRYASSLGRCRNFIPLLTGGITSRPGTTYVGETIDSGKARLIPFVAAQTPNQAYVLAFTDQKVRFFYQGAPVLYASGPNASQPVELDTPYLEAELAGLRYAQVADVLTIAHPAHEPRELRRYGHDSWQLVTINFGTAATTPTGHSLSATSAGDATYVARPWQWVVTAELEDGDESLPSTALPANPTATPYVVYGNKLIYVYIPAMPGARVFNIYRGEGSVFGFRGSCDARKTTNIPLVGEVCVFTDDGSPPAYDWPPPTGMVPFPRQTAWAGATAYALGERATNDGNTYECITAGNSAASGGPTGTGTDITDGTAHWKYLQAGTAPLAYPALVFFYQARRGFSASDADPQTLWLGKTNLYRNFNAAIPPKDDDAITRTLGSRQLDRIVAVVPLKLIVVLTTGAVYNVRAAGDDVLTPLNARADVEAYIGAEDLEPLVVGNSALFLERHSASVRDLTYSYETDSLVPADVSILSSHLLRGRSITAWAFARRPFSIVAAVRDDGVLLGMTWMREHEINGWFWMDTDGAFEDVCVIPEAAEDVVYVVVRRTVNGATKRYYERFSTRYPASQQEYNGLDCARLYDGRLDAAGPLTVSGAAYDQGASVTVTCPAASFDSAWADDGITLAPASRNPVRLRIVSVDSATQLTCEVITAVPAAYRNVATSDWARAFDELSGLGHLEGKTVGILADGVEHPARVVTGGAVTLDYNAAIVRVGLLYQCDAETLEVAPDALGRNKKVNAVRLLVQDSRAVRVGAHEGALTECKVRYPSVDQFGPPSLVTGELDPIVASTWRSREKVFIRQSYPLPLTVLAVIPEVNVGA